MSHRAVLEAMSGLMLGMFVAILSSTVVSTSLPRIVSDLGGSQASYTWVVTSTLLALTVSTPDLGQARRPLRPQAARADGPRHLRRRLDARRPVAVDGLADRLPRRPGHRRRRPDRARAGDPLRPRLAARARPLLRLPRRRVRRRHRRRPAARRRHHRLASAGAGASTSASRSRSPRSSLLQRTLHLPRRRARGPHRLPRRRPDRRRRVEPADLGLAGRPVLRLALVADRRAGRPAASALLGRRRRRRAPRAPSRSCRSRSSSSAPWCSP